MNKIILEREKYIPQELYRYRRIDNENIMCDKHVDALKKDEIYLTSPYLFNDPYDSAFSIDMELFKNSITNKIEQFIKEKIVKDKFEKININPENVENINIIYDDMNIDMSIMPDFLEKNSTIFYNEFLKQQIKFRISCFTESHKSILMWSHYSNQHQGFCIGYDTSKIEDEIIKKIYPVFYHETFFQLIEEGDLNHKIFNSLIKFKEWSYEKEWRLISEEKVLSLKPSKIYLGIRFNEEHIDLFKDIASEKNCKLFKMKMNYSEYALECDEIEL